MGRDCFGFRRPRPGPLPLLWCAHDTPIYDGPYIWPLRSTHTMHHHVGLTRPEQPPSVSLSVPHLSLARVPRRRPHSHGRPCSCPNPSTGGRRALDLACGVCRRCRERASAPRRRCAAGDAPTRGRADRREASPSASPSAVAAAPTTAAAGAPRRRQRRARPRGERRRASGRRRG